jgi:hypothetical protein
MSRKQTMFRAFLLLLIVAGIGVRIASMYWNTIPHGDTGTDIRVVYWLAKEGVFMVDPTETEISVGKVPYDVRHTGGERAIQHPPLWAMLGAGTVRLLGLPISEASAFFALKILSLLFGILLLPAAFFAVRRFTGTSAAWIVTTLLAVSWIMVDYSGNGSFYSLQAILFLLWLLVTTASMGTQRKAVLFGLISGIAYMLSYQCIFVTAASVLWLWVEKSNIRTKVISSIICTALATLIALPWFVRSALLFGDPFFGHAMNAVGYLYEKAGIETDTVATDLRTTLSIGIYSLTHWFPNNAYYIARKLFVLAPIAFFFFVYAPVDYVFDRERARKMLPILLLLAMHGAISAGWPITKFRFFVPMLPLVLIIAMEHLQYLRLAPLWHRLAIGSILVGFVGLSALTWHSIPSHTYYYDGAITEDPFGDADAEYQFMLENGFHAN